jgi:hypothetical protein
VSAEKSGGFIGPFPPFQFPLDGRTNEIGLSFSAVQGRLDPSQSSGWEPGWRRLLVYAFPAHLSSK